MTKQQNPFEFDAATTLSYEDILDFYIEDFSYARFIQSKRNVFITGERGSGKSMTLLYNSLPIQKLKESQDGNKMPIKFIGVYIPCNTPLMHKKEYELVENDFHATVISEHLFVLSILYEIASTLQNIQGLAEELDALDIRDELSYTLGIELQQQKTFFKALKLFAQRELNKTQETLNTHPFDEFYNGAFTFSSLVLPILRALKRVDGLSEAHINLLFDDAQDLNFYQSKLLNSWISYRDRTVFSLKVAVADFEKHDFHTSTNSSILEGHDFITLDMEKPYQRSGSPFGMFAKAIVEKRLEKWGITSSAEEYFPENSKFSEEMEKYKLLAKNKAIQIYGESETKKINDYVYKQARAMYFRDRDAKANLPPYSGWETITHVSTGVVRNLLEPCYWMYDRGFSELQEEEHGSDKIVESIPVAIQRNVLLNRSEKLWDWMRQSLSRYIDGCSEKQGKQIYNLFDNLAVLFRDRLMCDPPVSEPRAIVFTISAMTPELEKEVYGLLDIARKARLLYLRSGPAKDSGKRETYYVPNRMLWPIRGLDVVGQHARVSIKASEILLAADGVRFPFNKHDPKNGGLNQGVLDV